MYVSVVEEKDVSGSEGLISWRSGVGVGKSPVVV